MNDRYLVTGGGGFIGSHLVELLLRMGRRVTVLDDFSTGKRENLAGLTGDLVVIEGSVADPGAVAKAVAAVRGVVHLAALPSVARSVEAPLDSHNANATGSFHVLHAAARQKARVVYAGSSSAYGDQQAERKHEGLREDPRSPYAASKLVGELYARSFARVYQLPVVVTRFFNVFGPRQTPDSPYAGVVAAFCFALLKGRQPRIDGDGSQSRDFTYVEDVVRGVVQALDADTVGCEVVNMAYGQRTTVLELLSRLAALAGAEVEPHFAPPRAGDVKHSLADVSRVTRLFGFAPQVGFREGLRRTFEWYRASLQGPVPVRSGSQQEQRR
jgi:UDP-glucose 4-epimerase